MPPTAFTQEEEHGRRMSVIYELSIREIGTESFTVRRFEGWKIKHRYFWHRRVPITGTDWHIPLRYLRLQERSQRRYGWMKTLQRQLPWVMILVIRLLDTQEKEHWMKKIRMVLPTINKAHQRLSFYSGRAGGSFFWQDCLSSSWHGWRTESRNHHGGQYSCYFADVTGLHNKRKAEYFCSWYYKKQSW